MNIVYKKLNDLHPYEKNPRKNDDAIKYVQESIREFGFKVPIIIDNNGVIVAGHTRWKAAKNLNMKDVPCIVADDLTDKQIKAFRLADNKVSEKAEWDFDLLSDELDDLFDFDMTVFGFENPVEEEPEVEEDDFEAELPEEPKAKLGDIYQLGNHRLMCGDSTVIDDVEKLMGDDKADMVFTDPPWNVNYGDIKSDNPKGYKPRKILNDFMGTEQFKDFMLSAFECMNTVSKDGCITYVVMSAQEWGNMMLTLAQNNYHWSSTIIWNKDSLVLSRKDYHTKYEPIWYGWKEGVRLHPLKDRKQSDVWDIPRPKKSELHPTMKPVELVARAIENSSSKGDIVLDLFGGSGTTLIAAEQTGRCARLNELDPKYVDVIIARWEKLTGKKAVLLNGKL